MAAVTCWTADPCGYAEGEPGSAGYANGLLAARDAEAPWMAAALDYQSGRNRDVLDVGSGQGIDLIRFAQAGARVTGVDLTPRHIELARSHLAALGLTGDVAEGDAEGLSFPDDHFDIVVSNGVLHHTPNIDAALAEIWRVLRPGGSVRVVLYNRRSAHFWLWHWLWLGMLHGQLRTSRMDDVLSANVERTSIGARPLVRVYLPREARDLLELQASLACGRSSDSSAGVTFRSACGSSSGAEDVRPLVRLVRHR